MSTNITEQTTQRPPRTLLPSARRKRPLSMRLRQDLFDFYATLAGSERRTISDIISLALEDQAIERGFKPEQESAPSG